MAGGSAWERLRWASLLLALVGCHPEPLPELEQQAYVWQRAWGAAVSAAVTQHGDRFGRLLVLGSEVAWRHGTPVPFRPAWDAAALRGRPLGIAIRLGRPPVPLPTGSIVAEVLAVRDAALVAGLDVAELQLDLDCPTSHLAEYAEVLRTARAAVAPIPLTFTALPAWLHSSTFALLAAVAPDYVLQVHSLALDASETPPLLRTSQVIGWAHQAEALGLPFRLALPTYSYLVAIDAGGEVAGVVGEQQTALPPGTRRTTVAGSDPRAIAGLVRRLRQSHLDHLRGLVWFRLPVEGDQRNWSWPTLEAVLAGRTPSSQLVAEVESADGGLVRVVVRNTGAGDARLPSVSLRWEGPEPVAADGLADYSIEREASPARFTPGRGESGTVLQPGHQAPVGWLRWAGPAPAVQAVVESAEEEP